MELAPGVGFGETTVAAALHMQLGTAVGTASLRTHRRVLAHNDRVRIENERTSTPGARGKVNGSTFSSRVLAVDVRGPAAGVWPHTGTYQAHNNHGQSRSSNTMASTQCNMRFARRRSKGGT